MKLQSFDLGATDWSQVPQEQEVGLSGTATARTVRAGDIQLRMIEYSPSYVSNHWCSKGHIVFVVAGRLTLEHENGQRYDLAPGMTYQVPDNGASPHRAVSNIGAAIFVVD